MRARMIWMLLLTGAAFAAIFGLKWWWALDTRANTLPPPTAVATARAEVQTWPRVLQAVGTLVARNGTRIAPEVEGIVSAIGFESGQHAEAGQTLVELDSGAERGRVAALTAQLKLARLERDRYEDLSARKLIARAELDLRISQVERLDAEIDAERALLARKILRAPFAGELGIRQVSLGDYLKAGDPVVSLQSLDPIYLDFALPERVLAEVRAGSEVTAELEAYPGRRFHGKVAAIEPEIDPGTRNFRLRAELDNAERLLRPGAFARVRVQAGEPRQVLAVPQTAIRFEPYGNSVFVIAGAEGGQRTAQQRFIQTGVARGDLIAVVSGLEAGEEIAASGLLKLRNGVAVVVNNAVQPSAEADPQPENR